MRVYESKKSTKDGRKYFFKCTYYIKGDDAPKTKVSPKYLTKDIAAKEEQYFLNKIEKFKDCPIDMTFGELYIKFLENRKTFVKFTTYEDYPNKHRYVQYFDKIKCIDFTIEDFLQWKQQLYKN